MGIYTENMRVLWTVFFSGVALIVLLLGPPWPFLNQNQLKWQKKVREDGVGAGKKQQSSSGGARKRK
jgi:hypothetical protein